jgi:hypothetical protein
MAPQEPAVADDASDDVLLLADSPLRAAAAVLYYKELKLFTINAVLVLPPVQACAPSQKLKSRAVTSFRLMMGSVTRQCVECQLLMAGVLCGLPAFP